MPSADEYRCKSCNEEFLVYPKYFGLLPFPQKWHQGPAHLTAEERDQRRREIREWTRLHQQTFVCDPCELLLVLPRAIDAVTWTQWKCENLSGYRPYSDYPFLVKLVGLLDRALASESEVIMDFGQLSCPYCFRILVPKDSLSLHPLSSKCVRCGSSDLEWLGSGIASVRFGSFPDPWPPIA
jgi:hypothetical protein